MPMLYKVSPRVVRFTKHGNVKHTEVLTLLDRAFREAQDTHPNTERWELIVDLRDSSEVRTDMELRGFAMALTQRSPILSGRLALVVTEPEVVKQIRKFVTMAERAGHKPRVFRTVKDAEAWLKSGRKGR
jgi:hypothetical protein